MERKDTRENRRGRLAGIDFVRCACAVIIVCYHYSCSSANTYHFFAATANGTWGDLVVTVFFAVSGACLYASYPALEGRPALKRYFLRRWKAIFPMFYLAFAFFYLSNVLHTGTFFYEPRVSPWSLILTVFGLDGYLIYRIPNYFIIGEWFLGAIILLYCLYPLVLRAMKVRFLMPLLLLAGYYLVLETGIFRILPFRNLIICLGSFYLGMVMAKHRGFFFENRVFPWACMALFLLLAIVPLPVPLNQYVVLLMQFEGVLLFVSLAFIGRFLERFKVHRGIRWIAGLSYPVFLLHHQIVLRLLHRTDPVTLLPAAGMYLVSILASLAAAFLLSRLLRRQGHSF